MIEALLTLEEGARALRLSGAESFSRFARAHGIPLIRFNSKTVRIRRDDLERAIAAYLDPRPDVSE